MKTPAEVSTEVLEMLGVPDAATATGATIMIEQGKYPTVIVQRVVHSASGWKAQSQRYDLIPHPQSTTP